MESGQREVYRWGLLLLLLIFGISLPALSGLLVFPFSLIIPLPLGSVYGIGLSIFFFLAAILA